jgi:hypothetical protein
MATPTADSVLIPAAQAAPAGSVAPGAQADGLRCVRCRYLLRGLPDDGACPECGTPVEVSSGKVDLLRYQEPAWLGKLAEGFAWHAGANLIVVTAVLVTTLWPDWSSRLDLSRAAVFVYALYLVAGWMAALRVTTPEPLQVEHPLSLRRCVRLLGCTAGPLALLLSFSTIDSPLYSSAAQLAGAVHALLAATLWYAYVRRLALRAPSRSLAVHSVVLLWGYGVTLLVTSVLPWSGDTLFRVGVRLGNVYGFPSSMRQLVEFVLALQATYVCVRLRWAILEARSAAAKSRLMGAPAAAVG